jgi:hypothetical protein
MNLDLTYEDLATLLDALKLAESEYRKINSMTQNIKSQYESTDWSHYANRASDLISSIEKQITADKL